MHAKIGSTALGLVARPRKRSVAFYVRPTFADGWIRVATLTDADIVQNGIVGRPYILQRDWPHSSEPGVPVRLQRIELSYRAWEGAATQSWGTAVYRESFANTLSAWRPAEPWYDDTRNAAPVTLAWDARPHIAAPPGVRGEWSYIDAGSLVNCTLGATLPCMAGQTCCPVGQTCRRRTTAITTPPTPTLCVMPPLSGVDPLLFQGTVTLPPAADGLVPYTAEAFDDWPAFSSAYCDTIRAEQSRYGPAHYRESTGVDAAVASCPIYDRF